MKVRKAIIPAAGLGTRFLPATKAQPKEMLPIVDKPTIQYIVEEAIQSGIEDIIIVTGRGKRAIEDHFDKSYELEETLAAKEKFELLEEIQGISNLANIHYIRQKEPKGLGHAIACASSFVGDEPFAVMLGDDIVESEVPCLKQLIDVFNHYSSSVIGVQQVPDQDVSKYGIINPKSTEIEPGTMQVNGLVEKPKVEEAPSNYAIMGRYVLRPEIFAILKHLEPGAGGEIQLTDAINQLNQSQAVLAYHFDGKRYDVGDKLGFVKATVDFALRRDDLSEDVEAYLRQLLK
ncbi:UTP--glucose-1-phosphate uridylyltransferase GalU [Alkalihalobacterium chitinilyticum]|uniref:UTP--glucose-1-phosphate uridylyltransferase n=1 Tax=Alkalihalobacterium chitinilyticum TaxID=2980103 RepID=A0ABT5VKM9_9BACI|nr:UTP--glucose-1-phosphate uridylyltransferase GalU [Alkalihalobacterium chitinilyticum]MDE5415830.1 UTP--glucose-1-phosphate uridylyltransferase GalU [Alkalihalobacterium chitinilyticum]